MNEKGGVSGERQREVGESEGLEAKTNERKKDAKGREQLN